MARFTAENTASVGKFVERIFVDGEPMPGVIEADTELNFVIVRDPRTPIGKRLIVAKSVEVTFQ